MCRAGWAEAGAGNDDIALITNGAPTSFDYYEE